MRRLVSILALALVAALVVAPAFAQEPVGIRFIVRDAMAQPQPGITIVLDAGDGRGASAHVTDDTGATERMIAPSRLVTVTQVLDSDRTPLSFEMTTLDGLLVIPLSDDLDVPWAYDRASRSVISLPRTMANEAFPELEVLPAEADGQADLAGTPAPAGSLTPVVVAGKAMPESSGSSRMFWLILAGLVLAGAGMGLVVWAQARAVRPRSPAPRRQGRR